MTDENIEEIENNLITALKIYIKKEIQHEKSSIFYKIIAVFCWIISGLPAIIFNNITLIPEKFICVFLTIIFINSIGWCFYFKGL